MLNKNFNNPSLILYVLPYFAISWSNVVNLGYYTLLNILLLIFCLVTISILFEYVYNIKNKFTKVGSIISLIVFVLFLYGKIIFMSTYDFLHIFIDVRYLRLRWVLVFLFFIFFSILIRFNKSFKFLNIFSLVLFSIIVVNNFQIKSESFKDISKIDNSQIEIHPINIIQKPILLIITDEYASPNEIFKINRDSSVFKFSQNLNNMGWITRNNSYSNEISTIHSVSSIFNYNLSKSGEYCKQNLVNISRYKLLKNDFYDSMKIKKISIINFGIFDLGNSKPLTNLYNYPKNFLQQFLLFSTYFEFSLTKFNIFSPISKYTYYLSEEHNNFVFDRICDTINNENTFVYSHLLMPHSPFVLNPEFKFKTKTTNNYISYWNFVNKKLLITLNKLVVKNKYRIILTGDHGYRSDMVMNPNNTFTAFYGFNREDISKIQSVQDIGTLINGYYENSHLLKPITYKFIN